MVHKLPKLLMLTDFESLVSIELMSSGSIDFYGLIIENYLAWGLQTEVNMSHVSLFILAAPPLFRPPLFLHIADLSNIITRSDPSIKSTLKTNAVREWEIQLLPWQNLMTILSVLPVH